MWAHVGCAAALLAHRNRHRAERGPGVELGEEIEEAGEEGERGLHATGATLAGAPSFHALTSARLARSCALLPACRALAPMIATPRLGLKRPPARCARAGVRRARPRPRPLLVALGGGRRPAHPHRFRRPVLLALPRGEAPGEGAREGGPRAVPAVDRVRRVPRLAQGPADEGGALVVAAGRGRRCHRAEQFRRANPHPIIDADGCTACHDPHGGDAPKLLTSAADALCAAATTRGR